MARAAGSSTRASPAATPSVDTMAPGSRRLAPTTSVSTPVRGRAGQQADGHQERYPDTRGRRTAAGQSACGCGAHCDPRPGPPGLESPQRRLRASGWRPGGCRPGGRCSADAAPAGGCPSGCGERCGDVTPRSFHPESGPHSHRPAQRRVRPGLRRTRRRQEMKLNSSPSTTMSAMSISHWLGLWAHNGSGLVPASAARSSSGSRWTRSRRTPTGTATATQAARAPASR